MDGLKYEMLLRKAFGFQHDGQTGERGCDPAELAEASYLSDSNLDSAKIGAAYAITILSTAVINHVADNLGEGEYTRIEKLDRKSVV